MQDKYAAELPGVAMRAEPLGYDRHYRRYWWGLAGRRDVVMVEEGSSDGTGEGAGSVLREGQSRWREVRRFDAFIQPLLPSLLPHPLLACHSSHALSLRSPPWRTWRPYLAPWTPGA